MSRLLPYQGIIHGLWIVTDFLIIAITLLLVMMQRQVRFTSRKAGDLQTERRTRFFPSLFSVHRSMFPESWVRSVSLTVLFLLMASLFATQNFIRRDQYVLDMAAASSKPQPAVSLTSNH
jgi:hypothetical protein